MPGSINISTLLRAKVHTTTRGLGFKTFNQSNRHHTLFFPLNITKITSVFHSSSCLVKGVSVVVRRLGVRTMCAAFKWVIYFTILSLEFLFAPRPFV